MCLSCGSSLSVVSVCQPMQSGEKRTVSYDITFHQLQRRRKVHSNTQVGLANTLTRFNAELSSKQFQTMTTLCTPDLLFNYYRRHTFCLSSKTLLSDLLVNSNISRVSFEVWARFYYPNVRDQLVAKVSGLSWLSFEV